MATTINQETFEREDFSGAVQRKTIKFMKRSSEVDLGVNASFERIGGVEKVAGMSRLGNIITTSSTTSTSTSTSTSTTTSSSSTSSSSTTTA